MTNMSSLRRNNGRPPCIELLDDAMVKVLRRKTPAQRVAMVFDAERTWLLMLQTKLRAEHPEWTTEEITREIARRRLSASS